MVYFKCTIAKNAVNWFLWVMYHGIFLWCKVWTWYILSMFIHGAVSSRMPHLHCRHRHICFSNLHHWSLVSGWGTPSSDSCVLFVPAILFSDIAYVFRQGDLPKLDLQIDRGSDFSAWQTQWELYTSLSKEPDVKQVQALTLFFKSREMLSYHSRQPRPHHRGP